MKFRFWANIITFVLLALVVYFGRDQIIQAWGLMGSVNLWVFAIILPAQLFSYYAVGEVIFSYLKAKGNLQSISRWRMARIALELNFVNHIVPVPSIAGFSYLGWILKHHGVSAGRATMAQLLRFIVLFVSFVAMMLVSVIFLIFDNQANKFIISICAIFIVAVIVVMTLFIYFMGSHKRLMTMSRWVTNFTNKIVSFFTFGKKKQSLKLESIEKFFTDLHQDYLEMRTDKKILVRPFSWGLLGNILDVILVAIAFWALGYWVNPAALCIAYGVASFAGIFMATPGGVGAYEAIMIALLISTGVPAEVAIAGTLLSRATLFSATIIFGYLFYQLTINKYGKITKPTDI